MLTKKAVKDTQICPPLYWIVSDYEFGAFQGKLGHVAEVLF